MAQPVPARLQVQFDPFTADLRTGELFKFGTRIKLADRPFSLLAMLLEHPGEVVTRDEMRTRLWPDGTFVDFDNNISSAMGKLRTTLGDAASAPRYIETVGRGYRFAAKVSLVSAVAAQPEPPGKLEVVANPTAHRSRRWWIFVAASSLVVIAGAISYLQWSRSPRRQATKVMIAVLPFANLTGDPTQDYFSDGITEEMITQLGRLDPERIGVIARTSVMRYKDSHMPLAQISTELGAQYVLEGSVRRDSSNVRITAQLIRVRDQTHLLTREYDRELKDLLVLQAEIAEEVAGEIQLALGPHQSIARAAPGSLSAQSYKAYDLDLKGRYFWNKRTVQGFQQGVDYFQQAILTDPNYARAYAGLADSYALMSSYYLGPQNELMPKARAAAIKALQIDDELAEAHTSLALISENFDWDWQTAEKEYRRAIELDPNYATAHQWYAEFLAFQGRFAEAFAESERARQLDPLSMIIAADHAAIFYFSRQYERAIEQARGILDMDFRVSRAHGILVSACIKAGHFDDAFADLKRWPASDNRWARSARASAYGSSGNQRQARATLDALEADKLPRFELAPMMVVAYAEMDDKEKAFVWLQVAYAQHSNVLTTLKVDPAFDSLRGDPRFQDLLRRVRLAP